MKVWGSNFKDKNSWFHPGYTFKLVGKNLIKGVRRAPWSSILVIVNYCCTRVLLYAKMLKETENEETRLFWQIFVVGGILIKGARVPSATPWLRQGFWDKIAPLTSSSTKKKFN